MHLHQMSGLIGSKDAYLSLLWHDGILSQIIIACVGDIKSKTADVLWKRVISVVFLASVFFFTQVKGYSKGCSFYICLWNTYQILQTGTSSDDGLILLDFPQFCGKNAFQVMKVNFPIIQFPITKQSCLISLILLKEMLFKIWKFGLCPTWKGRCNFPQFSLWIWQGTKIFQSRSNNSGNLFKNINIL